MSAPEAPCGCGCGEQSQWCSGPYGAPRTYVAVPEDGESLVLLRTSHDDDDRALLEAYALSEDQETGPGVLWCAPGDAEDGDWVAPDWRRVGEFGGAE